MVGNAVLVHDLELNQIDISYCSGWSSMSNKRSAVYLTTINSNNVGNATSPAKVLCFAVFYGTLAML